MPLLENKVAIVTGASSGIGRAAAKLFAREGAGVVVGARRGPELDGLVAEIGAAGGRAVSVAGDVRDDSFALELVAAATRQFGGLDVAFNNAGTLGELGATAEVSLRGWRDTLETNLTSAFIAARHQIPALLARGAGSLIFTSTFVGYTVGIPGAAAYAASKSGLIGLVQALAAELGPRGIRVNALLPGGTDTPMARTMNPRPEAWASVERLHALKRVATADEQARSALYLASDLSSFTTGSALLADGGVSINRA
jgi:NAD(P)-dependent dehydrogenase (short-subunit alcohol dehydrogenase family)